MDCCKPFQLSLSLILVITTPLYSPFVKGDFLHKNHLCQPPCGWWIQDAPHQLYHHQMKSVAHKCSKAERWNKMGGRAMERDNVATAVWPRTIQSSPTPPSPKGMPSAKGGQNQLCKRINRTIYRSWNKFRMTRMEVRNIREGDFLHKNHLCQPPCGWWMQDAPASPWHQRNAVCSSQVFHRRAVEWDNHRQILK